MTSRGDKPDTVADIELRNTLDSAFLPAFTMIAGAGSGKTTSLVKALLHVSTSRGDQLRSRGQRVACITYTEVAANEIFADIGEDPLSHVSTVHSFLWSAVSPFQRDIARWVRSTLEDRETAATKPVDIEKYRLQLSKLSAARSFRYGLGPDLGNGVLGHEDVVKMTTSLLTTKPLLMRILARRFPIVFVDESQDTFNEVVDSLKLVRATMGTDFCLGFFGDPMQKIYLRGAGDIEPESDWVKIEKPENFRSPRRVLDVMNKIRSVADGLQQISGLPDAEQKDGVVRYFVLRANQDRTRSLALIREFLDKETGPGSWTTEDHRTGAKILVIAHRMAARRLGFGEVYAAFHDSGSRSLAQAFNEGAAWPTRFLIEKVLPLAEADTSLQLGRLREHSPAYSELRKSTTDAKAILRKLRESLLELRSTYERGGPGSIGQLLRTVHEEQLAETDARLSAYISGSMESGEILSDSTIRALDKLFECDVRELVGYRTYLSEDSPYSTQQGVKGAEFSRVLVVLDDEEARYNQFSYDKLLDLAPLSDTDKKNLAAGRESIVERTRRLLYVCTSRSTEALAVALYSADPALAAAAIRRAELPGSERVFTVTEGGSVVEI